MDAQSLSLLEKGLSCLGFNPTTLIPSFEKYLRELERWNSTFQFVHDRGEDLIVRHVLDSLSGAAFIESLHIENIADLGSGAGFPGIPLAISLKNTPCTLIEPSKKRSAFLKSVQAILHLENLRVWETDLEYLMHNLPREDRFSCVTFRAFSPLTPKRIKHILSVLTEGGCIVAYKGKRTNTDLEAQIAEGLGLQTRIIELQVPFLQEERNLLWISSLT